MIESERTKEAYLQQTLRLLASIPSVRSSFEEFWQRGNLREAYLAAEEGLRKFNITLSSEQRIIDEEFYWDFVN